MATGDNKKKTLNNSWEKDKINLGHVVFLIIRAHMSFKQLHRALNANYSHKQ